MRAVFFGITFLFILALGIPEQYLLSAFMGVVYDWFGDQVNKLKSELIGDRAKEEIENLDNIKIKRGKLGRITQAIGYFEFIFFAAFVLLAILFLRESFVNMFFQLIPIAGGWIALKVFGSYQQWSGAVFGRASFYIFLLGSILNIILANLSAYIVFHCLVALFY